MMPERTPQDFELFDTHAHLGDDGCPDETAFYRRAEEAGVPWVLLCGSDFESSRRAAGFASHFSRVFFAAGLHPLDIVKHPCEAEAFEAFDGAPRFVAVGEIGLDYYYERDTREKQIETFRAFLDLALRLARPAIVHTRDADGSALAYDDAYGLLSEFARAGGTFVLHSFAGSIADFERFDALGAFFGCGGMVTFKKADNIRALALRYPEDRILLETDSPYLAPVPFRGKENHPGLLPWTARSLAALRGWSMEKTATLTTSNAKRFFRILPEDEKLKQA
jgi:TatD DNase family protein